MDNKIKHKTLDEQVYNEIERLIVNNDFKPGDTLYLEKLAREFGVSTTPIRKALVSLEHKNIVTFTSKRCAVVTNISEKGAKDIWEYRTLIETYASRFAAKLITDEEINSIEVQLDEVKAHPKDFERHYKADHYLHNVVNQYCDNDHIRAAQNYIRPHLERIRYFSIKASDYRTITNALDEHYQILHALKKRNPDLIESTLKAHLKNGEMRMLEMIQKYTHLFTE